MKSKTTHQKSKKETKMRKIGKRTKREILSPKRRRNSWSDYILTSTTILGLLGRTAAPPPHRPLCSLKTIAFDIPYKEKLIAAYAISFTEYVQIYENGDQVQVKSLFNSAGYQRRIKVVKKQKLIDTAAYGGDGKTGSFFGISKDLYCTSFESDADTDRVLCFKKDQPDQLNPAYLRFEEPFDTTANTGLLISLKEVKSYTGSMHRLVFANRKRLVIQDFQPPFNTPPTTVSLRNVLEYGSAYISLVTNYASGYFNDETIYFVIGTGGSRSVRIYDLKITGTVKNYGVGPPLVPWKNLVRDLPLPGIITSPKIAFSDDGLFLYVSVNKLAGKMAGLGVYDITTLEKRDSFTLDYYCYDMRITTKINNKYFIVLLCADYVVVGRHNPTTNELRPTLFPPVGRGRNSYGQLNGFGEVLSGGHQSTTSPARRPPTSSISRAQPVGPSSRISTDLRSQRKKSTTSKNSASKFFTFPLDSAFANL